VSFSTGIDINWLTGQKILMHDTDHSVGELTIGSGVLLTNGTLSLAYQLPSTWVVTNATTGAYTNTVDFAAPLVRKGITNSVIYMTNFTGNAANTYRSAAEWIHIGGGSVNATVTWPAVGNAYGLKWMTNANAPLWTTLTNNKTYVVSYTQVDTNVLTTIILAE